ncbi:MAG: radical SAM protein [Elusimicrobiota bacterium]
MISRERKSPFVKLFNKTPAGVVCPHFYELVLLTGCPFSCSYCYLSGAFHRQTEPTLYTNHWSQIVVELEKSPPSVYNTGELADSLAIIPPLLEPAIDWFSQQRDKFLLLVTKSTNTQILKDRHPSPQIIVSFSVNSVASADVFESDAPLPTERLETARELKSLGWRIRIRLDPIILPFFDANKSYADYYYICHEIAVLKPERITIGSLRPYSNTYRRMPDRLKKGLVFSDDHRWRYPLKDRVSVYQQVADWLGEVPALCKETQECYTQLGWIHNGCNCTI